MKAGKSSGYARRGLALLALLLAVQAFSVRASDFLSFELVWTLPTDIDLYVKDPSGTTIFFANRTSVTGGNLPFDDTTGTGPENANWATSAPAGTYEFWAANYRGDTAVTCTFKVFLNGVQVGETKTADLEAVRSQETTHFLFQVGPPSDQVPVAVINTVGGVFTGFAPCTINFTAAGSVGGGSATVANYKWDFGDLSTTVTTVDNVSHTYGTAGVYVATLIVVNSNSFQSLRTIFIVVVGDGITNDGDLFISKADCNINYAKHAAGVNADGFKFSGFINPAGLGLDTSGASLTLTINGVDIQVLLDEANGRSGAALREAQARGIKVKAARAGHPAALNFVLRSNGQFNASVAGVDLRSALGVSENTPEGTSTQNLDVQANIGGVTLDTSNLMNAVEVGVTTKKGAASKGAFNFVTRSTFAGFFKSLKSSAKEADTGDYSFSASGPLLGEFGTSVVPNGPVKITIGDGGGSGGSVITIPLAALVVKGDGAKSTFTYSPKLTPIAGLKKFQINNARRGFQLLTDPVPGTGIPSSASAITAFRLPLILEVPTAAGTLKVTTNIEIVRKDGAKSWKR